MKPSKVTQFKQRAYDQAVALTLNFYEKWVLPPHSGRVSLLEAKKEEFRKRKVLLNPILRQQLLSDSTDEERYRLEKLSKMTKFENMETFRCTFDRHKDLYGYRETNFPASYNSNESALNYAKDPDWSVKLQRPRLKLKRWILAALLGFWLVQWKVKRVEEYDKLKRHEQRAMQNKEVDQFYNKNVTYLLFDEKSEQFIVPKGAYQVIWFDAKMKNYELLLSYIQKKRIAFAEICPVLVVDQTEHMEGVLKIWSERPVERSKVLLSRPLTEQESLLRAFDKPESQSDAIELELKKGFYYVVNPQGKIIDCARIYSFLHEDNIYQRIIARISQDVDIRINEK